MFCLLAAGMLYAQPAEEYILPPHQSNPTQDFFEGTPKIAKLRAQFPKKKTFRGVLSHTIDLQGLSNIIYAVTSHEANNWLEQLGEQEGVQEVKPSVYVMTDSGVYRHEKRGNILKLVAIGDFRESIHAQIPESEEAELYVYLASDVIEGGTKRLLQVADEAIAKVSPDEEPAETTLPETEEEPEAPQIPTTYSPGKVAVVFACTGYKFE